MKKLDKMLNQVKVNRVEPYIDYKFSKLTTDELKELCGQYGEVSEERIEDILEPVKFINYEKIN